MVMKFSPGGYPLTPIFVPKIHMAGDAGFIQKQTKIERKIHVKQNKKEKAFYLP